MNTPDCPTKVRFTLKAGSLVYYFWVAVLYPHEPEPVIYSLKLFGEKITHSFKALPNPKPLGLISKFEHILS